MIGSTTRGMAGLAALAVLAGCEALPSAAPADQAVPMAFSACLSRIDETAARIGQTPAVLAETSDSRIVRFLDEDEIVTVSCEAATARMVVQTRPAPVQAAPAAPAAPAF